MSCTVHLKTRQFEDGHSMDNHCKSSLDTIKVFGILQHGMMLYSVVAMTMFFNGQVSE